MPLETHAQHQRTATPEGVSVVGEAVRRVPPESAEFLIEITASAVTAAQALRDNQTKASQVTQAAGALGVHQGDVQTISLNVYPFYSPALQSVPPYGAAPQLGPAGLSPFPGGAFPGGPFAGSPVMQPDVQFGSYQARNLVRIQVREPSRIGEVVDAVTRAGAALIGPFSFKTSDEAHARRAALEAAGKDAKAKAEILAAAAGKQIGEAVAIHEDVIASNGALLALRSAVPFIFGIGGIGPQQATGDLEYYARVSASFRLQ